VERRAVGSTLVASDVVADEEEVALATLVTPVDI